MPKKRTVVRKAKKKSVGNKNKKARGVRARVRMDYGNGLDDLQERNEDVNQAAARRVREAAK
jgi:hypothetical protein